MAIGAVGGVTASFYNPYIYNTRTVSAASLEPVKGISDDATEGGVDFSPAEENAVNINPLRQGQSLNFTDILMSQLATSSIKQMELFNSNDNTNRTNAYMLNKAFEAYEIN